MLKKYLKIELLIGIVLAVASCGPFGGRNFRNTPEACADMNKEECTGNTYRCVYNIDACRDKFKKNDDGIPEGLGSVKRIVLSGEYTDRMYIIDSKDQLWGLASGYSEEIYPHPSKTYKEIAALGDRACAINTKGEAECFSSGKPAKGAPHGDKPFVAISVGKYDAAACAIDGDGGVRCYSDDGWLEKFAASSLAKSTKIKQVYFPRSIEVAVVVAGTVNFAPPTGTRTDPLIIFTKDTSSANGVSNTITPVGQDIAYVASTENTTCYLHTDNELVCTSGNPVPKELQTQHFVQTAVSDQHVCAIKKADNELVCWGNKRNLRKVPEHVKGVKQVAVSSSNTCYIDKDDKLNCFKPQD